MKGWKTVLVNGALGAIALTDYLLGGNLIQQVITDPKDAGMAVAVVTAINLVLRKFTSTPIGSKE
jgi:hypothetical protein